LLALTPGCASSAPKAPQLTREWLLGYWVPKGVDCESDGGVAYEAAGTWEAYGAAGRWRLVGHRLVTTVDEKWDDDEPPKKLTAPEQHTALVRPKAANIFSAVWEDGTVRELRRCPK